MAVFAYEGTLLDIKRKEDEYEGQAVMKIELKVQDNKSDEVALISFSEESWYSQGFFSRIEKVDLSRPFMLGVSASEQNEKVSFCWIKQGSDETIKVEKGSFPAPEKNSRGKMVYDKMLDAIEPVLQKLQKKLNHAPTPPAETTTQKKDEKIYTNASTPSDDLPF